MGMIITYLAVASWCVAAYMMPFISVMVWMRRHRDKTEVIQEYGAEMDDE